MRLAFDARGNLFVANIGWHHGERICSGSTAPHPRHPPTGLNDPWRQPSTLAATSSWPKHKTVEQVWPPGGTTPTETLSGLNDPSALAFDARGNLFVANGKGTTVSEVAPGSTTPTTTLSGLVRPTALAFDGRGNLFVAHHQNSPR